jgi:hypothetical protein
MGVLLFTLGLAVALFAHFPVKWFLDWVRRKSEVDPPTGKRVPNWITGTFERLLAFVLVIAVSQIEQVTLILLAWLGAKLAANWQRAPYDELARVYTISALMAGTLSVGLGVLGGVIARCAFQ